APAREHLAPPPTPTELPRGSTTWHGFRAIGPASALPVSIAPSFNCELTDLGHGLVGFPASDGALVAVDVFSGQTRWRIERPTTDDGDSDRHLVLGVVPAGVVLTTDRAPQEVRLLDPRTGAAIGAPRPLPPGT